MASTSTLDPLSVSAMAESPNWLEMPHELIANILTRLDDVEILNSVLKVCTTWWRICKDPAMWKVINIQEPVDADDVDYDLEALTQDAVDLSCGELIDISLQGFGTDDLLAYIVLRSRKLNSLSLTNCFDITSIGLNRALKMVPQLEKLHISYMSLTEEHKVVKVPNCPQLKSFELEKLGIFVEIANDDDALGIAKNMPELRHLQLRGNAMTKIGLQAILDGCPHLESLDVSTCFSLLIDENEVKLCKERIKNFTCLHDLIKSHRNVEYVGSDDDSDDYDYDYDDDPFDYM